MTAQAKPWTRVQDWVSLVGGVLLALSPLWVGVAAAASWAMVIIGVAIAAMAVIALAMPGAYIDEWTTAAGGVVAFLAPWLFSYSGNAAAAWTSWIVGVVVLAAALLALPASRSVYQLQHHTA